MSVFIHMYLSAEVSVEREREGWSSGPHPSVSALCFVFEVLFF